MEMWKGSQGQLSLPLMTTGPVLSFGGMDGGEMCPLTLVPYSLFPATELNLPLTNYPTQESGLAPYLGSTSPLKEMWVTQP